MAYIEHVAYSDMDSLVIMAMAPIRTMAVNTVAVNTVAMVANNAAGYIVAMRCARVLLLHY